MKKLFISILIILILAIASIYIFIPNIISIHESCFINANREGISRKLFKENDWSILFPNSQKQPDPNPVFLYNNSNYSISEERRGEIFIDNTKLKASTLLLAVSKTTDTTQVFWSGLIPTSYNPVKRLQVFLASKKLKTDIDSLLTKIQSYFSKIENVYGYNIKESLVVDSLLVSTYATSQNYPSVQFSYNLIERLKNYIAEHGAKETGFPMLNISTNDSIHYLTKVAIPVNKALPNSGNISFKQMLGGGNILVVDVNGGPFSINNAFHAMQNYINDYHLSAPAIPFLSLITDRMKEADTAKWVTKIYYPVM